MSEEILAILILLGVIIMLFLAAFWPHDSEDSYRSDYERTIVLSHYPNGRVRTKSYYDFMEDEDD